jgi:hypothetical protein
MAHAHGSAADDIPPSYFLILHPRPDERAAFEEEVAHAQ